MTESRFFDMVIEIGLPEWCLSLTSDYIDYLKFLAYQQKCLSDNPFKNKYLKSDNSNLSKFSCVVLRLKKEAR